MLQIIFTGFFHVARIFLKIFYANTSKEIVKYNSSFAKDRLRTEKLRMKKEIYDLIIMNSSKYKRLERLVYFCLGFSLIVIVGFIKLYFSR